MSGSTQKSIMVRVSATVWRDLKHLATQLELEKGERVTLQSLISEQIKQVLYVRQQQDHYDQDHSVALAVLGEVGAKHGIGLEQIAGLSRERHVVRARYEAISRLRDECHLSYPSIGSMLGRDHSSVMYGYRRHKAELASGRAAA